MYVYVYISAIKIFKKAGYSREQGSGLGSPRPLLLERRVSMCLAHRGH
jgi:hypothetical protein